jgi:hypothetical protein
MRLSSPALLLLACVAAGPARAQTVFVEVEPNSVRAEATLVACLAPGDSITGASTGTPTNAGDGSLMSADTFRLQTCALRPGIYRHELALSSATPLYVPTIRGLVQAGAPGSGGLVTTTDANFSTGVGAGTPAAPRVCAWYGFGRSEQLYWRVSGGFQTTQPYVAIYSSSPVSSVFVGQLRRAGPITISCVGQGHISDTDLWLYDAGPQRHRRRGQRRRVPDLDRAVAASRARSLRALYYLAVSGYKPGQRTRSRRPTTTSRRASCSTSPTAWPRAWARSGYDVSFAISDAGHSVPGPATVDVTRAQEIGWYRFEVLAPFSEAFCFGDGTQVQPCPCANKRRDRPRSARTRSTRRARLLAAAGHDQPDTMVLTCSGMARPSPRRSSSRPISA